MTKSLTLYIAWCESCCGYGYEVCSIGHHRKAIADHISNERVFLPPHPYAFRSRFLDSMEQARPSFACCHFTTLGIYGLVRPDHCIDR